MPSKELIDLRVSEDSQMRFYSIERTASQKWSAAWHPR
jgi:hypothetical protein